MQEKDIHELINDYLLGRIQPDELVKLESLRSTNPEVDLRVRQNEDVFRVLKYLRYKEIRQLLCQIDAKLYKKKLYNTWVVAILLLFFLAGIWSWMMEYFSPLSIAMRSYEYVAASSLFQGEENDVSRQNWELANKAFNEREFDVAILEYQSFLENSDPSVAYYARWNILLARFALAGSTPYWREEIKLFASSAPQPVKGKAESLLHLIDSDFYQIIIVGVPKKMSSFKPRLL